MKCLDCPKFDKKNEVCSLEPSEIEDTVCLLRWVIGLLIELQDNDEGESWKG